MSSFFATYLPSFGKLDHLLLSRWRISAWFSGDTADDRQRSLLRMLAAAHQQRLDPMVLVDNLASEHRGAYRRRLKRLARRLREGMSLIDALEQTPDVLSDETVLAIRFATQCGTPDSSYSRLIAGRDETDNRVQQAAGHTTMYASIIGVFAVLVVMFQMLFILPTLLKIWRDHNAKLETQPKAKTRRGDGRIANRRHLGDDWHDHCHPHGDA